MSMPSHAKRTLLALSLVAAACSSGSSSSPIGFDGGAGDAGLDSSVGSDDSGSDDASSAGDGDLDAGDPSDGANDSTVLPNKTYANPVLAEDFPDPFVLHEGGAYYAFGTNGHGKNIQMATSIDLATWTDLPDALPTLPSWAKANASLTWAPSILKRGTSFILYFTARFDAVGYQCIGRAIATTPTGPYVDDTTQPFICQPALCGSIDASPYVDVNGDAYLYWKSDENAPDCAAPSRIWTQKLGVDGLSLLGTPVALLQRDRNWEFPLIEGPSMIRDGSQYYLFYSANNYDTADYAIGYATCDTPSGPCTKQNLNEPFFKSLDPALGPGGQEFFTDDQSKVWMAYHAWTSPLVSYANGGARSLRIDPVSFNNGVPSVPGPSTGPQQL